MWYAVISEDVENSLALRKVHRPAHLARLHDLDEQGRLLIAGPHPAIDSIDPGESGFSGSLVVADFESLDQAQTWADQDPYILNGVYQKVVVKPYIKVLPK
ncbi:UNVERIFIED_CONTAM: hypothetical protein GTU68_064338 [Idotea baltica]|nr:hypothetical protein [Idotea baltica]